MKNEANLPFKVGDLAEARTFMEGYRGAWFRCKIIDITEREGRLVHELEYYDFPDEELEWLSAYQVPPYHVGGAKEEHRELMLRPHYPSIYNKKQMPHVNEVSEVAVVVNNSWKVGDLVDWCSHDAYWSGRIKQLLDHEVAKIELKPPPLGEGSEYDIFLKDLRPSLAWSPEHGWTVPTKEGGRPCARLLKPVNQVSRNGHGPKPDAVEGSTGSSARLSCCVGFSNSAVSGEVSTKTEETPKQSEEEEKCTSQGRGCSSKSKTTQDTETNSSRKCRGSEELCDTVDAVMKLEELLNKVKLLKKIMQRGTSSSDVESREWELIPK